MEAQEYDYIRRELLNLVDVDLSAYRSQQVQRRLATYLLRSGHPNWPSFFRTVRDDPASLRKLKDYLTINVSAFFRDPEKYEHFKDTILPGLLHDCATLNVWSAGCSYGQEPYSLAITLSEINGSSHSHHILATDFDQHALEHARSGGPYSAEEVANVPAVLLKRYFISLPNGYQVKEDLQRQITFRHHNLLEDPSDGDFDLIVCRNVVIYFTVETKSQLYRRFHDALRPGGVLFVGGTEIVSEAADIGLTPAGISFYRRRAD